MYGTYKLLEHWSVNLAKYRKEEVGGDFSNKLLVLSLTEVVESFASSKGSEGLTFISAGSPGDWSCS